MKHLVLLRAKVCPSIACSVTGVNFYVQLMDPRVMSSSMTIPLVLMLDMLAGLYHSFSLHRFICPAQPIYLSGQMYGLDTANVPKSWSHPAQIGFE